MMEALLNLIATPAFADPVAPAANAQGGGYSFIMMFVVFFLFMYFVMLRPQKKRAREQQNLLNSLAKGDEVMTAGGILGRITKIKDQYITLNLSDEVEMIVQKSSIVSALPKGTLKSLE